MAVMDDDVAQQILSELEGKFKRDSTEPVLGWQPGPGKDQVYYRKLVISYKRIGKSGFEIVTANWSFGTTGKREEYSREVLDLFSDAGRAIAKIIKKNG